jgi:1-acyl-sn-glycerol-3-phosphate acyltransferase
MTAPALDIARSARTSFSRLSQWIARALLGLANWRIVPPPPELRHCVLIGAPHTSNWDGVLLLLYGAATGLRIHFMIKASWLRGPIGPLMRGLGGIAIDRSQRHNTVEQLAQAFAADPDLILAVAPEGTRRHVPYWKSGFYHIALAAGVPIALGYADYRRRETGCGPILMPSGDPAADMDRIRAFYAEVTPRFPEKAGSIRLQTEIDAAE